MTILVETAHQSFITLCVTVIVFCSVLLTESRTHHKVHNLALYPERHSWCQAREIRQEIAHPPECAPTVIDNMVCLGACFSYSVPRAQDYQPIDPYCDKCDKTISSWTVVTLNCSRESNGEHYTLTRNVELITNCSCVDCNDNGRRSDSGEDSDDSHEEDVPDALEGNDLTNHHKGVIHTLKSVSTELHEYNTKHDQDTMINDNKIPSDDDDDHEAIARRERQRASITVANAGDDDDL
ncbi:neuroblastoma suppressor of tumorigenicity 1 [Folsomia candida]|uniref:Neuroblastoma suppressor of tumorigenicity 1 n=1 Tax=Folsomia candida TaxID=158441 RepID=A0A226EM91_FOLCA|nr:neuroblastoma suppressor of tumorigenicity 1 [Folsomia candida]OXA57871.1 Neuroblastoma suppressor of tumorigenicity 1 [Folsomia candida]